MKVTTTIPKGAIFTVTSGEYSDYNVKGVFKASKDIQPDGLVKEYLAEFPDQGRVYYFDEARFLAWVTRKGFLEPIHSFEWHLGSYGTVTDWSLHEME